MKTMTIPADPKELTAEWLTEALRSTGVIDRASVKGIETDIVGEGSGFIGQLARVKLSYDRAEPGAPTSLIGKFPGASEGGRMIGNTFDFYHREIRFYEEIADQVELRTPKRYYSVMDRDAQQYILLLEDLAPAPVGDQLAGATRAQAELAVRSIADFHATWWQSAALDKISDWMPTLDAPVQNLAEGAYQQAWQPFLENFGSGLSADMKDLGKRVGERVIKLQQSFADEPVTINHGDFRMDNLFFHDFTDGAKLAVADWQISTRGRGIFDVSYLLCGGMQPELRAQHERDLLRIYTDVLAERGVKGYGFDKAWEEYRRGALFMLVYVVIAIGTLDSSNERGLALFLAWVNRAVAAIEQLEAAELLPA